ncbi:MAG: hypothetical protein GY903_19690 [Fuerstiella sp.]|nr:hypothetical protein [Fuerstiella sp.]MCP4856710.1 hypothetical protein [Fuerstiella sp.]
MIQQFGDADGQHYFALAVTAPQGQVAQVDRHILLIDTSASQTGRVRESALGMVSQVLARLSPQSEVQIFAADVSCESLTEGFVGSASKDVNDALQKLSMRTPLGTTDLKVAFRTLLESVAPGGPTSVLYIGDGLTSANTLQQDELNELVEQFVAKRTSIHSLVIGPNSNNELPAILANLTGGTVATPDHGQQQDSAARSAASLQTAPLSVRSFAVDGRSVKSAGNGMHMLRSDRHCIVLGRGQIRDFAKLTAVTDSGAKLSWNSDLCQHSAGGPELPHLVNRVMNSNGVNAPLASLQLLADGSEQFAKFVRDSVAASNYLNRRGRTREATAIAERAAKMDSSNKEIKAMLTALQQPQAVPLTVPGAQTLPDSGTAQTQDPLTDVETRLRLEAQILAAQTNAAIDDARRISFDQPDFATSKLKDVLETIQASSDISPDVRSELERRVIASLSSVRNQQQSNALKSKHIARDEAVQEAQRKLLAEQDQEEVRLSILIDQVRGLLDRAAHGDINGFEDGETVSRTALDLKPGNGPATQALVMSEAQGQLSKAYQLVNLRHDRFLAVLYQVELSHVPFPDEPPIQYPPADVWRALTLTRVPRYESFDLRSEKPVEKWLRQMLNKPVPLLDFPGDTPLKEVMETISTYYTTTYGDEGGSTGTDFRMTIWEDKAELELEGLTSLDDVTVTDINFEGITLRNALKLIFEQTVEPELTYVIQNEVFMITTLAKAESDDNLVTRVYPVADLVIPPVQLGGGGGLQGGGGFGGGQQGGQQGGGGFGGQQGGQQGGGGFGGGGGQFSVPPEITEMLENAAKDGISMDTVNNLKKKPLFN